MRKQIFVALAIVLMATTLACAADKKEEAKAPQASEQQAPQVQKQPTLADYQQALMQLQGKALAYKQVKDGIEQAILQNEVQANKIQEKIAELSPKPASKPAEKK